MWNELESYKNHFLQRQLTHMDAESISKMVQKEFNIATKKRGRCTFLNELKCEHSTYFNDHADLAYGWYALPKLVRELYSDQYLIQWRALNSLSEFLLNPMQAQRAIKEMDLIRKLYNCFMRIRLDYRKEHYSELWRIMRIFQILSNYLNGAQQILHKAHFLNVLYGMIYDGEKFSKLAAKILRNLSEKPEVLLELLDKTPAFARLTRIFFKDPCKPHYDHALWLHLSHFLEVAPERGVREDFFELLHRRILGKLPEYHRMNMKCFALLLRCEEGQRRFDKVDGVLLLHHILNEDLDTKEYVMLVLLQGLHSKWSLWRCREFTDLPIIVVRLGKQTTNSSTQLYCLQVLRQLGTMPCIKRYMQYNCLDDLRGTVTCNELNECTRDELVLWLKREIYDSSTSIC